MPTPVDAEAVQGMERPAKPGVRLFICCVFLNMSHLHSAFMLISADDPLVAATARLLANRPELSNLELVQRLTRMLGEEVVRRVPVNRFQRQVRDPAMKLVRAGSRNGAAGPAVRRASAAAPEAKKGRSDVATALRQPEPTAPRVVAEILDQAMLEAFVLGASWDDNAEGIAAFRGLDELRRRVRDRLASEP